MSHDDREQATISFKQDQITGRCAFVASGKSPHRGNAYFLGECEIPHGYVVMGEPRQDRRNDQSGQCARARSPFGWLGTRATSRRRQVVSVRVCSAGCSRAGSARRLAASGAVFHHSELSRALLTCAPPRRVSVAART